jgi:hypothetical protein
VIELGIIAQFRDEAPYLPEWIEYHRLAGVDRFWLYDDDSADDWRSAIASYVDRGLVEVRPVPNGPGDATPTTTTPASTKQRATFRDGMRRASGEVRWAALIDVDEFLLPMADATIPGCLRRTFDDASAVYVNWRMFGTAQVTVPDGGTLLDRLTRASLPSHPENCIGKSLVRPDRVVASDLWYTHHFPLVAGSRYVDGGNNELCFGMRGERRDLLTRGVYLDEHIRINHYNLRDEAFFWGNRVSRAYRGELPGKGVGRLREHYESFGMVQDLEILRFLERHHPEGYQRTWVRSPAKVVSAGV